MMLSTVIPRSTMRLVTKMRPRSLNSGLFQAARMMSSSSSEHTVLVLGSSGALGRTVSSYLGRDLGMRVIGADLVALDSDTDWKLDEFIALPRDQPPIRDLIASLTKGVGNVLQDDKLDTIVVASGGFEADPPPVKMGASDGEVDKGALAYGDCFERMLQLNLYPVVAAGHVAERFMDDEGLLVVMGATAALSPTPGLMCYGVAKSAAHQVVQTLGASTGKSATTKPKRKEGRQTRRQRQSLDTLTVVGILPSMIDTPANRKADPKGDFDKWTKPIDIAKEIGNYIESPSLRPHSGSLVKVYPKGGGQDGAIFHLVR